MTRFVFAAGAAALGLIAYFLAHIFGLNGSQWDGWMRAFFVLCPVMIVTGAVVLAARRSWFDHLPTRRTATFVSIAGAALATISLVVKSANYSDPYEGPHLWPELLAWVGFVGFVLVAAGLVATFLRHDLSRRWTRH